MIQTAVFKNKPSKCRWVETPVSCTGHVEISAEMGMVQNNCTPKMDKPSSNTVKYMPKYRNSIQLGQRCSRIGRERERERENRKSFAIIIFFV